jgi:ABC-2 type transport system permease protein
MKRDYRELRNTAAFRVMLIVAAAVMVAATVGISIALSRQSWLGDPATQPLLGLFISLVLYFIPLVILISFIWAFANLPVIKEKVNGNTESLMATPLLPRDLWLGKSLAIYLPAYIIAIVASVVVVAVVNLAVILPSIGGLVLPVPALVLGFVVNPLLFLILLLFMVLFALASNPDIAMAPSFILGFGLMMGMPVGLGMGKFDFMSWDFLLWYLAGTMIFLVVVLCLSRILTRQNIVFSSKGS